MFNITEPSAILYASVDRLKKTPRSIVRVIQRHRRIIGYTLLLIAISVIVGQFIYPRGRLTPNAYINNQRLGAISFDQARQQLADRYNHLELAITIGSSTSSLTKVQPTQLGFETTINTQQLDNYYPWYYRLIPGSILWYGKLHTTVAPQTVFNPETAQAFIKTTFGTACHIPSRDARIAYQNNALEVVPAVQGGSCDNHQIEQALSLYQPILDGRNKITIAVTPDTAVISDQSAEAIVQTLNQHTRNGLKLTAQGQQYRFSQAEMLSWLDFGIDQHHITWSINQDRLTTGLAQVAKNTVVQPGTTTISTTDHVETKRTEGATGRSIDYKTTSQDIKQVFEGTHVEVMVKTVDIAPKVVYDRHYTHSALGIEAAIAHFDASHGGSMGVYFSELQGARTAQYQSGKQFTAASTYKLFVAYSTLRRIDNGQFKWSDTISGKRNLETCFEAMIAVSDNLCAEALIAKIGSSTLNAEIKSLGLTGSAFTRSGVVTTAQDLGLYLRKLRSGSLPIASSSRERLISSMKRNIYRSGIPKGASGSVANKVGFLGSVIHDAAIVYSPKGDYVLIVLTSGSSWGSIADVTRTIESLR